MRDLNLKQLRISIFGRSSTTSSIKNTNAGTNIPCMDSTLSAESYFRSIKRNKMYSDLYEYLVLNKRLSVPGVGTFLLERKPAATDLTHRQINSPAYTISLDHGNETPAKKLFYWLADKLNIHYHEAIVRFNGFAYDLKNQ